VRGTIISFLLGMALCSSAFALESPKGKEFYTKVSIWYENPKKIPSTNYHVGAFLAAGTKVKITGYSDEAVEFEGDGGIKYNYIRVDRHTVTPMAEMFAQLFSAENEAKRLYDSLDQATQVAVDSGELKEGMSKDVVLMVYGYPPSHVTPNLTANLWVYWFSKATKVKVIFNKDKVIKIESEEDAGNNIASRIGRSFRPF